MKASITAARNSWANRGEVISSESESTEWSKGGSLYSETARCVHNWGVLLAPLVFAVTAGMVRGSLNSPPSSNLCDR